MDNERVGLSHKGFVSDRLGNLMKKNWLHHHEGRNGKTERASLFSARPFGFASFVLLLVLLLLAGNTPHFQTADWHD